MELERKYQAKKKNKQRKLYVGEKKKLYTMFFPLSRII
jgi:hypothetical protein